MYINVYVHIFRYLIELYVLRLKTLLYCKLLTTVSPQVCEHVRGNINNLFAKVYICCKGLYMLHNDLEIMGKVHEKSLNLSMGTTLSPLSFYITVQ